MIMIGGKQVKIIKKIFVLYLIILFLPINNTMSYAQEVITNSPSLSQNSISQLKEIVVDDYGISEIMLSETDEFNNLQNDLVEDTVSNSSESALQENTPLNHSEEDAVSDNSADKLQEDSLSDNSLNVLEESVAADSSFYYIQGNVRDNGTCFSGDIVVIPTGKDGYDSVRLGTEGEFSQSATIREDAINKTVLLQFSNGELTTKFTEFVYSKDTIAPTVIHVAGEHEKVTDSYTFLASPLLTVEVTDGFYAEIKENSLEELHMGSGVDAVYVKYSDTEYRYEVEENYVSVPLPEDFSGKVEIWCVDKAGNTSDVYRNTYITDMTKPQMCIMTKSEIETLEEDEIQVDIWDVGQNSSGVEKVTCLLNGEEIIPELTVSEREMLENTSVYSFCMSMEEEEQELQIQVLDNAGNIEEATYWIQKEEMAERYRVEMPNEIELVVDPYEINGLTEIFSKDCVFKNLNDFPMKLTISSLEYSLTSRFSEIEDPCELFMHAKKDDLLVGEETYTKEFAVKEIKPGNTSDVIECELKPQESLKVSFDGSIADATRPLWQPGDLKLKMTFRMEQIRGLTVTERE